MLNSNFMQAWDADGQLVRDLAFILGLLGNKSCAKHIKFVLGLYDSEVFIRARPMKMKNSAGRIDNHFER